MAGALALAAVTALLKQALENALAAAGVTSQLGADAVVSALPPDRIAGGEEERPRLNLFLYLATPHVGLPATHRKDRGAALVLDLHYLLTAYGAQDLQAEVLLGHALRTFHDTPVLEREQIESGLLSLSRGRDRRVVAAPLAALGAARIGADLDRLVIEAEFMNVDAISKLWSALQTRYRPSACYKVAAVFIDHATARTPARTAALAGAR
jgi:hypothetical protein